MIMRRIATSLRQQDWATVVIELFLVIAGVLIALEFDNWNKASQDRAEERDYLVRLQDDMAETIALFDENIASNEASAERVMQVVTVLNTKNLGSLSEDQLRFDVMIAAWRGTGFVDSTLDELTYSSNIGLIKDRDLRKELARLRYEIERVDRAVANVGMGLQASFASRALTVEVEVIGGRLKAVAPLSYMMSSSQLRTSLTQIAYLLRAMNSYLQQGKEEAARVYEHLERVLVKN